LVFTAFLINVQHEKGIVCSYKLGR